MKTKIITKYLPNRGENLFLIEWENKEGIKKKLSTYYSCRTSPTEMIYMFSAIIDDIKMMEVEDEYEKVQDNAVRRRIGDIC